MSLTHCFSDDMLMVRCDYLSDCEGEVVFKNRFRVSGLLLLVCDTDGGE